MTLKVGTYINLRLGGAIIYYFPIVFLSLPLKVQNYGHLCLRFHLPKLTSKCIPKDKEITCKKFINLRKQKQASPSLHPKRIKGDKNLPTISLPTQNLQNNFCKEMMVLFFLNLLGCFVSYNFTEGPHNLWVSSYTLAPF